MKILLVLEATLGGTARHIMDLAGGLLATGNEVHLLYSGVRADQSFKRGLQELQKSAGFHGRELEIRRGVGFGDVRVLWEMDRYHGAFGPFDIVHGHSTKAGFLTRIGRRRGASVYTPHALMTQDPGLRGLRRWAVSTLERTLARRCDAVIAISSAEHACAVRTGIAAGKLTTIHNGAQLGGGSGRAEARARLGLQGRTFCVGSVGLLVANKEHPRLMDAFATVHRELDGQAELVVIGWGPLERALREKARALGLGESVRLLGQVPAREYLAGFDALAHPSRYEGFAYTFLEALDAGVPVVTANVGGAAETVLPGITGFICDPWDTEVFAARLLELARDEELRAAMGRAGREHVQTFKVERMVAQTLALYERLAPHPVTARAMKAVAR